MHAAMIRTLPVTALLVLAACSGDQDIAERREAAREQAHEQRVSVPARDTGATVRDSIFRMCFWRSPP